MGYTLMFSLCDPAGSAYMECESFEAPPDRGVFTEAVDMASLLCIADIGDRVAVGAVAAPRSQSSTKCRDVVHDTSCQVLSETSARDKRVGGNYKIG